jgi:hypothetical protein
MEIRLHTGGCSPTCELPEPPRTAQLFEWLVSLTFGGFGSTVGSTSPITSVQAGLALGLGILARVLMRQA